MYDMYTCTRCQDSQFHTYTFRKDKVKKKKRLKTVQRKREALLLIIFIRSKPVKGLGKLVEHKEKKDDVVDSGCSAASPLLRLPKDESKQKEKEGRTGDPTTFA